MDLYIYSGTLTKFTNTLQQYHRSTLQFKDERQKNEKRYSEQLQECQKQIQQVIAYVCINMNALTIYIPQRR